MAKEMEEEVVDTRKIFTKELLKTLLFMIVVIIIVKFLLLEPFLVKGSSMEPNFQDNNYIFVESITYVFATPKRGDVVVFKHPEPRCSEYINKGFLNEISPFSPCTNYIKRIIGVPGETIIINNGTITVKNDKDPNGFLLNEEYIPDIGSYRLRGNLTKTLGKDEFFVLGDNRQPNQSSDSREWGVLPKNHITGKAWLRLLPLNEIGSFKKPKY